MNDQFGLTVKTERCTKNSKDKKLVHQLVRLIVNGGCETRFDCEHKRNQHYQDFAELFCELGGPNNAFGSLLHKTLRSLQTFGTLTSILSGS
jgi:hypothetical protein